MPTRVSALWKGLVVVMDILQSVLTLKSYPQCEPASSDRLGESGGGCEQAAFSGIAIEGKPL